MSVLNFLKPITVDQGASAQFVVMHPLDDLPEKKLDTSSLGPMRMTTSVRTSLMTLRCYLVLMMALVLYHVMDLAGVVGGHTAH